MLFSIALTTNKKTEDCLHINAFLLEYVNLSDYISKTGLYQYRSCRFCLGLSPTNFLYSIRLTCHDCF